MKEEVECRLYEAFEDMGQWEEIIQFYNGFVDSKDAGIKYISMKDFEPYIIERKIFCTKAFIGGELASIHIYFHDDTRCRLWYSCSQFRNIESNDKRNAVGRANRYLHWFDMLQLKGKGFTTYDWGGYSEEEDKISISDFKLAYGGVLQRTNCTICAGTLKGRIALWGANIKHIIKKENRPKWADVSKYLESHGDEQ